jgi:hypothetical protein
MQTNIINITDSKCIKAISYNKDTQSLFIKFNDSPFYEYAEVDEALFNAFVSHPKKGQFYHQIKTALGEPKRLDN